MARMAKAFRDRHRLAVPDRRRASFVAALDLVADESAVESLAGELGKFVDSCLATCIESGGERNRETESGRFLRAIR